jgi:5-methylcytosine-specific restriction protein A
VDHIIPGDNHDLSNLMLLSTQCHKAKTARESAQRNEARARLRLRPVEQHPGLIER